MGEEFKQGCLYMRRRENWFKELLYKLKILKPKQTEIGIIQIDSGGLAIKHSIEVAKKEIIAEANRMILDEDIEIVKEFVRLYKEVAKEDEIERSCYFEEVPIQSLENVLNRLEQDEKIISKLKSDYENEVSLYNSKEQLKCNTEVMRYLEVVLYE